MLWTGEINGKAGNLNNAVQKLFPGSPNDTSPDKVVAIFDCDQICNSQFFMQTLPLLHRNTALVRAVLEEHLYQQ